MLRSPSISAVFSPYRRAARSSGQLRSPLVTLPEATRFGGRAFPSMARSSKVLANGILPRPSRRVSGVLGCKPTVAATPSTSNIRVPHHLNVELGLEETVATSDVPAPVGLV